MLQNLEETSHNTADSALGPALQRDTALVMGEAKETQSGLCRGTALRITQGCPSWAQRWKRHTQNAVEAPSCSADG